MCDVVAVKRLVITEADAPTRSWVVGRGQCMDLIDVVPIGGKLFAMVGVDRASNAWGATDAANVTFPDGTPLVGPAARPWYGPVA